MSQRVRIYPKEECGLFAVYGHPHAAGAIYNGLFAQQHRGQEGAGIVVSDGTTVRSQKGLGLVHDVFSKDSLTKLPGSLGIGHVRYSTTGDSRIHNVQPLVVECMDGIWAAAHNGNLVNAGALRRYYQGAGSIFQTSTDSEVLVHLLSDPEYRAKPRRVARALDELEGSFSFLIMTKDCIMGARDRFGFRPLSIGRVDVEDEAGLIWNTFVLVSETCALTQMGAEYIRDVLPGELVTIDETGLHSSIFTERTEQHLAQCVFELVYFARPDSTVFGHNVHGVRLKYGMRLAEEHPVEADIVIAVPDSGNCAALGYSLKSGIPLDIGFIRNHYVGRTFIMPDADDRSAGVDMKLSVLKEVVHGKRVVVVDDSIVRGTTSRRRVHCLREAGAREIHMRISCPPTAHPCFYGIDFPDPKELIASKRSVAQIREFLGADSVGYLSHEGLLSPFPNRNDFCSACFTGEYPVDPKDVKGKKTFDCPALALDYGNHKV